MTKTIHCDNCGANMNADSDKMMMFCPYCGAAFPKKDDILEYSRFKVKHDEEVRQRQVAEKQEAEKRNNRQFWIIFAVFALIVGTFLFLASRSQ